MKKIKSKSAYGGSGFIKRLPEKVLTSSTEYGDLKKVLLYLPGPEIHQLNEPNRVQHLEPIDSRKIRKEIQSVLNFFRQKKIAVIQVKCQSHLAPPNLFFLRDLCWSTPKGIVVSRMGSEIRKPEEKIILKSILENDLEFYHKISSPGIFEGADALWINSKTLMIGINNRTNTSALNELKSLFPEIEVVKIELPKKVQHLLGMVQIVAPNKVLLRSEITPPGLLKILKKYRFKIIEIPEIDEVVELQGMNVVTIKKNQIIMPDDCPILESLYKKNNIHIVEKFNIRELRKAAGGLACLTGILQRVR